MWTEARKRPDGADGKFVKPTFYGDYFSTKMVPLKSKDIFRLNIKWINNVINNSERIEHSYKIMKQFIDDEGIIAFYQKFFNNKNFKYSDLMGMMHYEESLE